MVIYKTLHYCFIFLLYDYYYNFPTQEHPNCRQGQHLKKLIDDQVITDGLIGAGVGGAAIALVGGIIALALGAGKR